MKPTVVDLFAGGGGLSEGLRQAGFEIIAAVENNFDAAATFKANHPNTAMFQHGIEYVAASEIKKALNGRQLDLLTGCPPCQGFSRLTAKYKRNDPRNYLIMEMGCLVETLMPKVVMVENVSGIQQKGKYYLSEFIQFIEEHGYIVNSGVLQVADYGIPQMRQRFVLVAGLRQSIPLPVPTHAQSGKGGKLPWQVIKTKLINMTEPKIYYKGNGQANNWHVVRDMSPINKERLKYIKPGGNRFDIPDHLRPKCHQGKNTGFSNVYGRMSWNAPSPTITGGCTTLSKGRFAHPDKQRTVSVREAALLQGFPQDYIFDTDSIDSACTIIGNAFPCELGKILGLNLLKYIS